MRRAAPASIGVAVSFCAYALALSPAAAQVPAYDQAYVDAFAAACVPERMSYEGTKATALKEGWREVTPDVHPELDAMMKISEEAALAPDLQNPEFSYAAYTKPIEGADHYLLVSRASAIVGEPDDPLNPWAYIGCYLYNFEAAGPIDIAPVTALIGHEVSHSQVDMHINGWVWGPPCPMPRTGDTYLTFLPEVSQYTAQTGFSGLVLKFETSEPDADEIVPETYC